MSSNITTITYGSRVPFIKKFMYDYGQYVLIKNLEIKDDARVCLSNSGDEKAFSVTPTISSDGILVGIPNVLFESDSTITGYIENHTTKSSTVLDLFEIRLHKRSKPQDFISSEEAVSNPSVEEFKTLVISEKDAFKSEVSEITKTINESVALAKAAEEMARDYASNLEGTVTPQSEFKFEYLCNMFNAEEATIEKNWLLNTVSGNVTASNSWCTTEYIEIEPNRSITVNKPRIVCQYDENKKIIGTGQVGQDLSPITVNLASNAKYIRTSFQLTDLDSLHIQYDGEDITYPSKYQPPLLKYKNGDPVTVDYVKNNRYTFEPVGKNLYDPNTSIKNTVLVIDGDGVGYPTTSSVCNTSNFIKVGSNVKMSASNARIIAQYNKEERLLSITDNTTSGSKTITTLPETVYIRISADKSKESQTQLEYGAACTSYEKTLYGLFIDGSKVYDCDGVSDGGFTGDLGEIIDRIEALEKGGGSTGGSGVDYSDEIEGLQDRVEALENDNTDGTDYSDDIENLQDRVGVLENVDIIDYSDDITDLQDRVETLESNGGSTGGSGSGVDYSDDIEDLQADVTNLQGRVDALEDGGVTGGGSTGGDSSSGSGAGDHIDIRDFGAVDDGVTDNYDVFMEAFAAIPNGGTIQFPRTEHGYAIYNAIYVPEYVSLVGNKTKIIRKHDYNVHHNAFVFRGHNNFENFIFDGGGCDAVNMIQYTDFSIHGNGVVFQNNEISDNRGTCIGGYGNCTITNNFFGEYGDHLVYMGGGSELISGNYIFTNNHVVAPLVRRDAMKFRNAGKNIIVSNNLFNIPNATVCTFTNGDNYLDQGLMENLMITNNNIVASRYLCVIGQQLVGNENNTGKIKNVLISGNIINTKEYMIIGDSLLQDGDDMTNFVDTTVTVSNNTFEQTPFIHITSVGNLHTIFEGNTFKNLNVGGGSLFAIRGDVSFDFTNNVVDQPDDDAWNLVTLPNKFTAYKGATTAPARDVKWNIAGNTLHGFRILLADNADGEAYFNEHTTTTIRDNILYKTGLISSLGTATGDGQITLYNNLYYYNGELSVLTVGRPNTLELGVANIQTLTGTGSPAGVVTPRCVGDTYLDMTNKTIYTAFYKGDKNNGWYSSTGGSGSSGEPCQVGTTDPSGVVIPRWAGDRYINTSTRIMYVAAAEMDKNTWFPVQRGRFIGEGDPNGNYYAYAPGEVYTDTSTGVTWTAMAKGGVSWVCDKYVGQGSPVGVVVPKNIGDKYIDKENQLTYTAYAKNDYNSWKSDSGDNGNNSSPCQIGATDPSGVVIPRWAGDRYVNTATRTMYIAAAGTDKSTWFPVQRKYHTGEGSPIEEIYAYDVGEMYLDTTTGVVWVSLARGSLSWVCDKYVGEGSPVGVVVPKNIGDKYIDKENQITYTAYVKNDYNSWKSDVAEEIDPCQSGAEDPSNSLAPRWDGDIYINKTSRVAFIGAVKNDGTTWTPVQRAMHLGEGDPNSKIYAYVAGETYLDTTTNIKYTAMAKGGISWVGDFQVGEGSPVGVVPPRFVGDRYIDKENKKTYTGYIKLDMHNGWGVLD